MKLKIQALKTAFFEYPVKEIFENVFCNWTCKELKALETVKKQRELKKRRSK